MATKEEKLGLLERLTGKEMEVMFYFCQGKTDEEISKLIAKEVKSIGARRTKIYEKLQINVPDSEKLNYLYAEFCPLVSELIPDEEAAKRWRPRVVGEIKEENGSKLEAETDEKSPEKRRNITLTIGYVLVLVILATFIGFFLRPLLFAGDSPTPVTVIITATSEATGTPQSTPSPVQTKSEAAVNPTIAATNTPPPTNTPSPSAVPTEPAGFFDNFDNGLDPGWTVVFGKPVISNGQLQSGEQTLLSVGDTSWTDYTVEFDVKMGRFTCQDDQSSTLGVRASDMDNMLLLRFHPCETEWSSVINGNRNVIPRTFQGNQGFTDVLVHFIVTVEGNKITFHEKSTLLNSFIDTDHPSGNVYLRIRPDTVFDNFKITLLNP